MSRSPCPIRSDPGAVGDAPFYDQGAASQRAFLRMDDYSFASRGCPPENPNGLTAYGCAAAAAPCPAPSPSMAHFWPGAACSPAMWLDRPDLSPLERRASS